MWCGWELSSWIGIFAGAMIPGRWSLEFASTLALIALLIPLLFDRAVVCGALAAGGVALIAAKLPLNLGLLAAIAVGVAGGLPGAGVGPPRGEGRGLRGGGEPGFFGGGGPGWGGCGCFPRGRS